MYCHKQTALILFIYGKTKLTLSITSSPFKDYIENIYNSTYLILMGFTLPLLYLFSWAKLIWPSNIIDQIINKYFLQKHH